jgi:hypothetical protein
MIRVRLALGAVIVLTLFGCTASHSTEGRYWADRSADGLGLFPEDEQVLSDAAIQRALAARVTLPASTRVVVVPLDRGRRWYWSDDLNTLSDETARRLTATLEASERIREADLLPALLTTRRATVPQLRAAGARSQADLLVLYRVETRTFQRRAFLAPVETRAYSNLEALLLDVRTGLIPFSTVVSANFEAEKTREEHDASETRRHAELQAVGAALEQLGREVRTFLETDPELVFPDAPGG